MNLPGRGTDAPVAPEAVWNGAPALEPFLVPIDSLEPFPGNPRQGDVEAVAASLRRFGQVVPILVENSRIVAGHARVAAAQAEGWTHIAAVPNDFASDDEARAYLLADNRTHDLGPGYDTQLLVGHLRELHDIGALEGTGYDASDLDDYLAELARVHAEPAPTPPPPDPPPPQDVTEVVLFYSKERLADFETWRGIVAKETGADGVSEAVYEALKLAAEHLNQK